jgi:GntR family transcriptional regulator/MocR family aminotransferase
MDPLDSPRHDSLHGQLYARLREAILSGALRPGQRLSSSRALAAQEGLARNTVLSAYSRLEAEGYVKALRGSGHYVSPLLPAAVAGGHAESVRAREPRLGATESPSALSAREPRQDFSFVPASLRQAIPSLPFRVNYPALDEFPLDTWLRLQARLVREAAAAGGQGHLLGETEAQGESVLRQAIAEHVAIARGVQCRADDIVITAGAQHALDLLLRVLTAPGDVVGLEDPCYPGALSAARSSGLQVVPLAVDDQGASLPPDGRSVAHRPSVLIVCPSRQFPMGVTMSLPRRLSLIDWARRHSAWVIEDDYDSEYRFEGRPIPSLQGLDGGQHVIYVGTYSKVLFPSLRIGFIVAPRSLRGPLVAARAVAGRHGSALEQRVLARFIADGHLARHVRRMRALYQDRQAALLEACRQHLGQSVSLTAAESGLQTLAWLDPDLDDQRIAARGREQGIELAPLSRFRLTTCHPPALLLGFGGFAPEALRRGVAVLAKLLR